MLRLLPSGAVMQALLNWLTFKDVVILVLLLTISIVFIIKTTKLQRIIAQKFSIEFLNNNNETQRNYIEHGIFHELYMATNIVDCEHRNKKQCFEAFLKIYNEVLYEQLSKWVSDVLQTKGSTLEEIFKVFSLTDTICLDKARSAYVVVYSNNKRYNLKGIPEILVEKFQTQNNPVQLTLNEQIKGILNDILHNSWQDKLLAILDIVEAQYRVSFRTNSILQSLNGEIDREVEEWVKKNV